MQDRRIEIIVGLPHLANGAILRRAKKLAVPALISANCLSRWTMRSNSREWAGWNTKPLANAHGLASLDLDSAGYTALSAYNGYPWTAETYMQMASSYPFRRIASLDYCVEPEIARDRHEVLERISRTIRANRQCRTLANDLGMADRLMPVLQGRYPQDYERCADALATAMTPGAIIGIGSMCRRHIHGPDGLIAVVEHLDRILPKTVRLHAFGVKGSALPWLSPYSHRITSIDSQAWALQARLRARRLGISKTDEFSANEMEQWLRSQSSKAHETRSTATIHTPAKLATAAPCSPWVQALQQARAELRSLIEAGELEHDQVTAGWVEQWAADLIGRKREAA